MSAFRCCCWSINCEGGRQIKSFESFVFESQNVSDVCCCCCRCCFCLVCHVYPGDVVVVVVRLSLTLDLGNATCFTHLRKGLSVWWRSRVCWSSSGWHRRYPCWPGCSGSRASGCARRRTWSRSKCCCTRSTSCSCASPWRRCPGSPSGSSGRCWRSEPSCWWARSFRSFRGVA